MSELDYKNKIEKKSKLKQKDRIWIILMICPVWSLGIILEGMIILL